MTDRVKGLVVVLEKSQRVDDMNSIIQAISLLRGVSSVEVVVDNNHDQINRERIRHEFKERLWKVLEDG